ncbi:MAG TPA: protein kinase [Pyrinomonadaceae bacterium]
MICSRCQHSNEDVDIFCRECGNRLGSAPPEPTLVYDSANRPGQGSSLTGKIIEGKYKIESQIGVGGMGTVYRGSRLLIGDEVAIKILHQDKLSSDPQAAMRFRREAQAAARLKHPNAVSIYDFGISADGLQYLVMELIEGRSLRQIIEEQGPLAPSDAAEVIKQTCAALDEAHRHNIIHRDIKPDNIIINVVDGGLRVKVLDFGIAKLRDQSESNLTQTGNIVGTPHYMSPEQCLGEELDSRSDIYSLGVVVYEMMCGVVPFKAPVSMAVVVQHVNQPPPPLRAKNPGISASVEAVVLHALGKKRESRPQTAGAFAREFVSAVSGVPTVQMPRLTNEQPVVTAKPPSPAGDATLVLASPPINPPYAVPGAQPPAQVTASPSMARVVMLTTVTTLLVLGLGAAVAWLLFSDGTETETSREAGTAINRNQATPANSATPISAGNRTNVNREVVSVPTPSPTIAPTAPVADTSTARTAVLSVMSRWADSLRRRDLYDNVSLYADRLSTYYQLYGISKDKVRANRQSWFAKYYSSADVRVSDLDVTFDSSVTTATVSYTNTYDWRGGTRYLTGRSRNEIVMSKMGGSWLITSEKHVSTVYESSGN